MDQLKYNAGMSGFSNEAKQKLSKTERVAARSRIEEYHRKKLAELLLPLREALIAVDDNTMDIFELDYRIDLFSRQSKELGRFVNYYYPSNDRLPTLPQFIDEEERGEWHWEPKRQTEERN